MFLQSLYKLKKYKHILAFSFLLSPFSLFLSSCSTFDPPLVVPIYGHIDSIHFTVPLDSLPLMGSASSKIQYAWVYLDDNPVGAFQMPCTFPMIGASGLHNVKIYPGVTPVGTLSPAAIYPFYQFYSFNITMNQGAKYTFHPTSVYNTWVKFPYLENFNSGSEVPGVPPSGIVGYYGDGVAANATTTTMIVVGSPLAYQGNSGMVIVNAAHPYYIGITNPGDSLPNSSTPVYIELNYRCNTLFSVGVTEASNDPSQGDSANIASPTALVYPAPAWTKMYISLNTTLQQFSSANYLHTVYFSMQWQQGDPVNDTLLLDNIKILY